MPATTSNYFEKEKRGGYLVKREKGQTGNGFLVKVKE